MLRKITFCLLFLVSFNLFANPTKQVVNIQHWHNKNNVPVYFVRADQLPMVDIMLIFNAGSARDGNKPGLAYLTSHMITQGTAQLNADQVAKRFADVGANFNVSATRDMATIAVRTLTKTDALNPTVKTFSDIISHPAFNDLAFTREKARSLQAVKQEEQAPGSVASLTFYKLLYGNSPYAHSTIGTDVGLRKITVDNIKDFYKQYYVNKNALIVMVGDLEKPQAEAIANQITHALPQGQHAEALKQEKQAHSGTERVIPFPSEQSHIRIGELGITRNSPDYYALKLGNHILGGGSLTSRLNNIVREKYGLTYGVFSYFMPLLDRGPFVVSLQTKNSSAHEAIKISKALIDKFIKSGPTDEELTAAKKNIIGSFPILLDSNANILANVANIAFFKLPLDYLDTYRHRMQTITKNQIVATFQKHLNPERMITVIVGQPNKNSEKTDKLKHAKKS